MIAAVTATLMYTGAILIFLVKAWERQLADSSYIGMGVIGVFVVFSLYQSILFLRSLAKQESIPPLGIDGKEVAAVVAGALCTSVLIRLFAFSPVAASSLVGIVGSFLTPGYPFSVFCGSFVGMTSPSLLNYSQVLMASLVSGAVFVLGRHGFHGMGGKLGVTAFAGVWIVISFFATPAQAPPLAADAMGVSLQVLIVLLSGVASFCTFMLNQRWNIHIVASAGMVGLTSVVLLSVSGSAHFHMLTAAVFCASFAGMCNRNRLRGPGMYVLVGLLSGLLFMATIPVFHQYGGKLGTIAFIAALVAKTFGEWLLPGEHEFFCED